jgi:Ran GTPase-activating protein (RanGAP) involved in mRNA processing and transport
MAGAMMTEELKGLKRLLLQNNEVRDQGARALFLACTMDPPRYCPSLESLNLRLNHISAQQMRNMRPAPAYLQF